MYFDLTGREAVRVRTGFSDCDTYGFGLVACVTGGAIDAPTYMPQGSVRVHNTMTPNPQPSLAHRDYSHALPLGCGHDGPEAVPPTLYLHSP